MNEQAVALHETALLYKAVFETDVRGQKVFAHLTKRFASGEAIVTEGGIDAVLQTYRKAANREVLDFILTMLDRADQGPSQENLNA
jgi:hypothetical protein